LNKGFALAKGDIIGWINSDDYYQGNIFRPSFPILKALTRGGLWVIWRMYSQMGRKSYLGKVQRSRWIAGTGPRYRQTAVHFFSARRADVRGRLERDRDMVMDYDLWVRLAKLSPPAWSMRTGRTTAIMRRKRAGTPIF